MQRASSGSGEADGDGHYSGASEAGRITTGKPGSGTSHPPSLTWDDPERIKLLHALEEMDVLNRWRPGLNTALWEQVLDTIWERNSYEGRYRRPLVSELSQMFSDIYGAFLRGPRGKARKGRGLKYEELSEAECAACQRLRNIFDQMQMRGTPRSAEEMEEGLAAQAAARKRQRAAPAGLAAGPSAPPPAAAAPGGFPGLLGMAGFANFWAPEAAAAGVGPGAADPEALRVMGTLMSRLDECLAVERQRRETELSMWRQHEQHMLNQISVLREQLEVDHSQISMLRQLVTEQNHSISDLIGPMDRA